MKIKVCGITTFEEADDLSQLDIDYMGFIFAESKRRIAREKAKELIQHIKSLNPKIKTVGVFVNEQFDEVIKVKEFCGIDILQLHGNESYDYCKNAKESGAEVWKALSVDENFNKGIFHQYDVSAFLLDSKGKKRGGNGVTFDWNIISGIGENHNLVLAGGLNNDNVLTAIKVIKPTVVDVNSGVERNGKKDIKLVKEFVNTIKLSQ